MDPITGLTLDSGALIALDRGAGRARALIDRATENGWAVAVPSGALAQTWRDGARQARLSRLLAQPEVTVPVLDEATARAVGILCGRSGHSDVVDVHVALHATELGHHVVTSDPDDIRAVNPSLRAIAI
jgi:hypothetical protein